MGSLSWHCPLCNTPLSLNNGCWTCLSNHSFDVAKEGYVNLLLAQNKKSRDPGDSKEMIKARRAFLNQSFFSPLATHVSQTIKDRISNMSLDKPANILDCGCGEGYYTNHIKNWCGESTEIFGLDISKPAIKLASKSNKNVQFAVASAFSIPLPDKSLHLALQIFSPSADDHIQKKIQPEGALVRVTPGTNHLVELRDNIYEKKNEHIIRPPDESLFRLEQRESCEFTVQLDKQSDIENLLMMTPHFWKASATLKESLLTQESMRLSADFVISTYAPLVN